MMIDDEKNKRGSRASAQQRQAAHPAKSVWVQASAGTGKTKVLSDRVLRILLQGGHPGRILCLTYTKAAAVEMNSRISERLSKWAVMPQAELWKELEALLGSLPENPDDMNKLEASARRLFAVLLDTPGGMKIQTIHSFCQEILKRFPLEAHISPYFEVMDDRAAQEALADIQKKMLCKIKDEPTSDVAQALAFLTQKVSEFSFPKIMGLIADNRSRITEMLKKYHTPAEILSVLAERLAVLPSDTEEGLLLSWAKNFDKEKARFLMNAWMSGSASEKEKAQKLASLLEREIVPEDFFVYGSFFLTSTGGILARTATKAVLSLFPDFENVFYAQAEQVVALRQKLAALRLFESTRAVLFLSEELISAYNHFKKIHSKMDYEDLIVLTKNLLSNPGVPQWLLYKLDGGIDNILIDEAQDTSPNQWAIIRSLTGNFFDDFGVGHQQKTVFAVGDKKQSIYSFQGADPKGFVQMRDYFASQIPQNGFEKVNLEVSFRSVSAVLGLVNVVFDSLPAKDGVVDEGEDITHLPFRVGDGGKVELWPLIEPKEDENPNIWRPAMERSMPESTSSRLARQIAERIKKMVENGEELASQKRPIRYRDFMILVQRRNSFVEELVRACKNVGVSIAGVDKIKLLEQIGVQDLVSLGKFLLLPTDDLSLAEVLKSPLFGLDDDDLFELCYNRGKGGSVWSRLGNSKKFAAVYETLQSLCSKADVIRPFELYSFVLNKLKGRQKFVSRLGYEVEDGLDEFVNLTLNYEQGHIPTLQGFVDWIAKDEVEIKRELEQSEADAVRIMTVHGSKGLQAPIVILPDTVRVSRVKNESGMLWDDIFYYPLASGDYDETCKKIKQEEKELALQEYRRLLYVALTRAEDRLYICGYYKSKKNAPSDESWYKICEKALLSIGQKNKDDVVVFEEKQDAEPKAQKIKEKAEIKDYPHDWIWKDAQSEDALAKPLAPSKMDEEEPALSSPIGEHGQNRYRRGLIIHKLLQFLPDAEKSALRETILSFLQKNAPEMNEAEMHRIVEEVSSLLENPKFSALFGANSKAEVPIMGVVDGKVISGQVDRLVVQDDKVMIVDYKTNRPAAKSLAEVPLAYFKQMEAYKSLLSKIYENKKIETLILWTDTAEIMVV